jgi:hypothetical protein
MQWLETTFWAQEAFVCDKRSSSDATAEIKAVPISSIASLATMGHD